MIRMKASILALALMLCGCSAKAGYFLSSLVNPLEPAPILLDDGTETLYYTYTIGDAAKTDTVLFFFAGSGCHSLKYYLKKYLESLDGNIQVFGLQKRFVSHGTTGLFGCPAGFDEVNHFPQWITDHDWFIRKTLATLPKKPKRVLLLGVSEGAHVAAAVAVRNSAVTHLAIIGNGGMRQVDELRLLVGRQYPSVDPAVDFDAECAKILAEPQNAHKRLFGQTYKYWASVAFFDPLDYFLPLQIPIIVGFGEKDQNVPVESVRYLERRFQEAGKKNLTLIVYPGADHTLTDSDGRSYRPDFLRYVSDWLKSHNDGELTSRTH